MYQNVGTNMMSRRGKGTTFEYNVFHTADPLLQHKRDQDKREAEKKRKEQMLNNKYASMQQVKVKQLLKIKMDNLEKYTNQITKETEAQRRNVNYSLHNYDEKALPTRPENSIKAAYDLIQVLQAKPNRVDEK